MSNISRYISRFSIFVLTVIFFANAASVFAQKIEVTHGPILGKVSHDGMGIWIRTSGPGNIEVKYGRKKDRLDQSTTIRTEVDHDCTGWVYLNPLLSNTQYFYQVPGRPVNSFKTLPNLSDFANPTYNPNGLFNFSFEFGSCNHQQPDLVEKYDVPTYLTMNRNIAEKVSFAILNGDFIYEQGRGLPPEDWGKQMGIQEDKLPELIRQAPSIVGVWQNYKIFLDRSKALSEWHSRVPSFFIMDDHEIIGDTYGAGEIGRVNRKAVFRDIATQAWYNYLGWSNPMALDQDILFGMASMQAGNDVLTDLKADFTDLDLTKISNLHVHWGGVHAGSRGKQYDELPGDPNAGVYRLVEIIDDNHIKINPPAKATKTSAYSVGRQLYGKFTSSNCDFYLLDTRTNREMHDVKEPNKADISMLGKQQKEWLMKSMQESDATFHFVISSVNLMIPHRGSLNTGIKANKDDAWTVFLDERDELINFWDDLNKPVFVLTADLHNSFAAKITDNVWEFASSPHSSKNHLASHEGGRAATGRHQFDTRPFEIRWSSYFLDDTPKEALNLPIYCVVQVNNIFNSPREVNQDRWVAYPHPQVIFQYYNGKNGELLYAEAISAIASGNVNNNGTK